MQNLYKLITDLVEKRETLIEELKPLFLNAKNGTMDEKMIYITALNELKRVEKQIANIENKYAISVADMSEVISRATGKQYTPKIFREVTCNDGKTRCTYSFTACFVNDQNVQFYNPYYEVLLVEGGYHKLLDDIAVKNGIVQFSGSEMFESEQLNLKEIYSNTNFLKMFTQPKVHTEVSKAFEKRVKPLLAKHLQSIKVSSVDKNLGCER